MSDAADIIARLGLRPHPEGGHYVETFRDGAGEARARSTAIYFLLAAGDASHWHRVDAVEYWLWHAGAPLMLAISDGATTRTLTLGADLASGELPQGVVPEGRWQAAQSLGAWTLVSCIVAPGFEFSGFTLAPPAWTPE